MLLTVCRGGKKSPSRWCVQVEHDNLTPGLDLAVLGINRTALQGLNIYGKSRKIKGLQARKVLTDSTSLRGSSWGDTAGSIHGLLGPDASGLSRLTFLPVPWCYCLLSVPGGPKHREASAAAKRIRCGPFFLACCMWKLLFSPLPTPLRWVVGAQLRVAAGDRSHDGVAGPS